MRRLYELDLEQMAWRRDKIAELQDPILFKQEYPATAAEAFQMTGHDSFIPPALVAAGAQGDLRSLGPLVIGYDPAWMGETASRGVSPGPQASEGREPARSSTPMQAAGWLKQVHR